METRGTPPKPPPPQTTTQEVAVGSPSDDELHYVMLIALIAARRYGAGAHEVDEVAQSTVIKLWKRWDHPAVHKVRVQGGLKWDAYIRRTAKNAHLDLVRSHQRRLQRNTRASGLRGNTLPMRPGTVRHPPKTPNGIDAYVARQTIIEQIDGLPAKQRVIARMIILDEHTPKHVAKVLGMQPQSVRKHLRAAKETLIAQFEEDDGGADTGTNT